MQRILFVLFGLSIAVAGLRETQADQPQGNPGLPKVDFQLGLIYPVGQGLAIPVKNGGFASSPGTTLTVTIYDRQSRQLLKSESRQVAPLKPNQTRRVIVVPPTRKPILVRAKVDPSNQVPETNERNNSRVSSH